MARPSSNVERLWRWCRRNKLLAGTAATATVLAVTAVTSLVTGYVLVSQAQSESEQHRIKVERQAAALRERLYVTQMAAGFREWNRGNLDELRMILDEFRGDPQLQGFEWRWLDSQAKSKPREVLTYIGHEGVVYCATFSPDGKLVASCGEDRSIQIWDAATGAHHSTLRPRPETAALPIGGHAEDENRVRFLPDGQRLASVSEDGSVRLWNLADGTWQPMLPSHQGEVYALDLSRDGRWMVTAGADKVVRVRDVRHPASIIELRETTDIISAAKFTPDDREIVVADKSGMVHIWDLEQRTVRLSFASSEGPAMAIAVSPDGAVLATGGNNHRLDLWSVATGNHLARLRSPIPELRSLHFSLDGCLLAGGGYDGVCLWSLPEGNLLSHFNPHSAPAWSVQFAADGQHLLTAGADKTARIWNLAAVSSATPQRLAHTHAVTAISFTSDGKSMALRDDQGQVRIADLRNGNAPTILSVLCSRYATPVFAPNGSELAFVGPGGSIRRWGCTEQRELPVVEFPPLSDLLAAEWMQESIRLAYTADNELLALRSDGLLLHIQDEHVTREQLPCRSTYPPPHAFPMAGPMASCRVRLH